MRPLTTTTASSFSWPGSLLLATAVAAAIFTRPVRANTEKVIFTAPAPVNVPLAKPSLSDLNLDVLGDGGHRSSLLRTNLTRVFPLEPRNPEQGEPAWLLLDNLTEGQRYELRVCWSALEPTSFTIDVYSLDTVWETPELIQSLAHYATSRQPDPNASKEQAPSIHESSSDNGSRERKASIMLLRVRAAADYFSHNKSLMKTPPPVLVDLILDPYVYNIVPRSLLPTAGYIVVVGIVAWFVAQWIAGNLISIAESGNDQKKKQN
ncbi:hypothetical protein PT974_00367 [Cladobotryum mycophilum]|uniref:Uncharacterized protein n=1 Tax=Cladobotryum mycophilum TaxID=491253 RepID=A0ABR0T0W1_9HYPO